MNWKNVVNKCTSSIFVFQGLSFFFVTIYSGRTAVRHWLRLHAQFVVVELNSFRSVNLNVVFTWTLNKVIGLKCAFICHELQIGIDFFLTCTHCTNIVSPALFLYLFLTVELIFFHFWINIHTYQKNAPPRTQNELLDDDYPKQGLVGGCPAPLNSCRVKGEFYNDRTCIYTTLYSEWRTARCARHTSLCYSYIFAHAQSFQFSIWSSVHMHAQSY